MQGHAFKLKPSLFYIALWLLLIGLSLMVAALLQVGFAWRLLTMGFVAAYGVYVLLQHVLLRNRSSVVNLAHIAGKTWLLQARNHEEIKADLCNDSVVTAWFFILRFQSAAYWPNVCVIFRDGLARDEFSRLSVLLRHA